MTTLNQVETFLAQQPIALIGVSRNQKKFGYMAFSELLAKGYDLLPVNSAGGEILGKSVFKDVNELPAEVKGVIVMTKKEGSAAVVKAARDKGIKNIWIQQGSETKELVSELKESGLNLITGECIMMYAKPSGIHKFHRAIVKFFGRLPK